MQTGLLLLFVCLTLHYPLDTFTIGSPICILILNTHLCKEVQLIVDLRNKTLGLCFDDVKLPT